MNHPEDSNLDGALEALRSTPKRDPARIAAGRAAFLNQAEAAQRQRRAALFTRRLRRWRVTFAFLGALLTGSAGAVYASQESLPNSPLYPVKLVSEDVQLAFAPSTAKQRALLESFAERRRDEIASAGESEAAARARQRLADHEAAIESIERAQAQFEPLSALIETPTATPPRLPATATALVSATPASAPVPTETALPTQTPMPFDLPSAIATASADVVVTLVPTETPLPTPRPRIGTATAVAATRESFATRVAPTQTSIAATREVVATRVTERVTPVATAIVATLEAIPTRAPGRIVPTVSTIVETRIAPTREAIATQLAPTAQAIRATLTALPDLRATAIAAFPSPQPPAPAVFPSPEPPPVATAPAEPQPQPPIALPTPEPPPAPGLPPRRRRP